MVEDRNKVYLRSAALARPELREDPSKFFYNPTDKVPDEGRECEVKAHDKTGDYVLPFPVLYKPAHGGWFNANHDRPLAVRITGWRYK